jgi:hypothetical protein
VSGLFRDFLRRKNMKIQSFAVSVCVVLAAYVGSEAWAADLCSGSVRDAAVETYEEPSGLVESAYMPYRGYGSVQITNDGIVRVYIDGDPPAAGRDRREPAESYALVMDTHGLSLACSRDECFLDRYGTDVEERNLTSDVSLTPFLDPAEIEAGDYDSETLVEINGDLGFDILFSSGSGEVEVLNGDGLGFLRVEFGVLPDLPSFVNCCSVWCGVGHGGCWRCCFFGEQPSCSCAGGDPVCQCEDGGSGTGGAYMIDVGSFEFFPVGGVVAEREGLHWGNP